MSRPCWPPAWLCTGIKKPAKKSFRVPAGIGSKCKRLFTTFKLILYQFGLKSKKICLFTFNCKLQKGSSWYCPSAQMVVRTVKFRPCRFWHSLIPFWGYLFHLLPLLSHSPPRLWWPRFSMIVWSITSPQIKHRQLWKGPSVSKNSSWIIIPLHRSHLIIKVPYIVLLRW